MTQFYLDPSRESDPYALPDAEVFYIDKGGLHYAKQSGDVTAPGSTWFDGEGQPTEPGWFWWSCFPGCLPDGDPVGPFDTEALAIADAQKGGAE